LGLLAAIHLLVLGAGFFAPYPFAEQNRDLAYSPPTPLRFFDTKGHFHPRPFIYRLVQDPEHFGTWKEDRTTRFPIRFFVHSKLPRSSDSGWNRRLFGVDAPARIVLLGTDALGRDQFSRLLYGGRISLFAGLFATALSLGLAVPLGTLAGFRGGPLDDLLMRASELFMALPWLFLLIAVRSALPLAISPSTSFLLTVTLVGCIGWAQPARLVRGVASEVRNRGFVLAARGSGASELHILRHHVLPRTLALAFTHGTLLLPQYILAEVSLSFLGLGMSEPVPSLGTLLAQLQEYYVLVACPWMFWPAAALAGVVITFHLLAGALPEGPRRNS
jgi:peptide/nickel transport system permease protein